MLFNSATFLVFFAAFYLVYTAIPSWNAKKWVLLLAGLVFYGWFNPYYIGLLFLSALIDHLAVQVIVGSREEKFRKAALTACRLQLAEGLLAAGLGVGEAAVRSGFPHPDALRRAWRGR